MVDDERRPAGNGSSDTGTTCYVPGLEHDVFISYAHIDNEKALLDDPRGWIDEFRYALKNRLRVELGDSEADVWLDKRKLRSDADFDEQLIEAMAHVGVLVSVISPAYTKSKWCLRELKEFFDHARERGRAGEGIFPVWKESVPIDQLPPAVKKKIAIKFFAVNEEDGTPHLFDTYAGRDEFTRAIRTLATKVAVALEDLREPTREPPPLEASLGIVYLAPVALSLETYRDDFKSYLEAEHYTVVPDTSSSAPNDQQPSPEECDLSVYMLGDQYAEAPTAAVRRMLNDLREHPDRYREQLYDAVEGAIQKLETLVVTDRLGKAGNGHGKSGKLAPVLWLPSRMEDAEDRQRALLTEVLDGLATIGPVPPPPPPAPTEPKLYLVCDKADLEKKKNLKKLKKLTDVLAETGMRYEVRDFGEAQKGKKSKKAAREEQANLLDEHKRKLTQANAVLLYYGEGSAKWLQGNLEDARRLPGPGGGNAWLGIYVAGPDTKQKQLLDPNAAPHIISKKKDLQALMQALAGTEARS